MKPWFAGLTNWLSIEVYQIKSSGSGLLFAVFAIMSLIFIVTGRVYDEISRRKTTPVIATIKVFGYGGTKYHPGLIAVTAQDDRGLVGTVSVPPFMVEGCKVGDIIKAGRYGMALTLSPAPCPIKIEPRGRQTPQAK